MSRTAVTVLTRVLLVIFTFVLIGFLGIVVGGGQNVSTDETDRGGGATVDPARLRACGQVVLQSVLEMAAS